MRAEGRGVYAIFIADVDLFSLFLGFTVTSAITFFIANKKIAVQKLIGVGLITILFGLIVLIVLLFSLSFVSDSNFLMPKGYINWVHYEFLVTAFLLVMLNTMFNSIFQGYALFYIINGVTIFNSIINFLAFGIYFFFSDSQSSVTSVNEVLLISLAIYFLNFIAWFVLYIKYIGKKPVFSFVIKSDIKPFLIFISLGHLSHILNFLTFRMDYWILEHFKGIKELGFYAQAVGLGQMFWSVTNPIAAVMIPYLVARHANETIELFKFYSRLNFSIVALGVLIAYLLAPYIFPLYGHEFTESVLPFRIILPGILMSCVTKIFATFIYTQNKIHYNLFTTIVGFTATIVLDFLLIPYYGKTGASVATSISYSLSTLTVCFFLFKKLNVTKGNFLFVTRSDVLEIKGKISNFYFNKSLK